MSTERNISRISQALHNHGFTDRDFDDALKHSQVSDADLETMDDSDAQRVATDYCEHVHGEPCEHR